MVATNGFTFAMQSHGVTAIGGGLAGCDMSYGYLGVLMPVTWRSNLT